MIKFILSLFDKSADSMLSAGKVGIKFYEGEKRNVVNGWW